MNRFCFLLSMTGLFFVQISADTSPIPEKGYILNVGRTSPPVNSSVSIIDTIVTPPSLINNFSYSVNFIKGSTPIPQAIAITPDGTRAYIANNNSNIVSVIDTKTDLLLTTILLSGVSSSVSWINSVAITTDGKKAYFVDGNNNDLHIIDIPTNTAAAASPISLTSANFPSCIAIDKNGYVYVGSFNNGNINIINSNTDTEIVGSPIASNISRPFCMAINSQGYLYTTSNNSNLISIINTATRSFQQTMAITSSSAGAAGIAITKNDIAYIANNTSRINVIDTKTNTETAVLNLNTNPTRPFGIAISSETGYAYIMNFVSNSISVLDTATNTEIAGSPFSSFSTIAPFAMAIIPPYIAPPSPSPSAEATELVLKSLKYNKIKLVEGIKDY